MNTINDRRLENLKHKIDIAKTGVTGILLGLIAATAFILSDPEMRKIAGKKTKDLKDKTMKKCGEICAGINKNQKTEKSSGGSRKDEISISHATVNKIIKSIN